MALEEEEESEEELDDDVEYMEFDGCWWGCEWVPARQQYCWWVAAADHTIWRPRGSSGVDQGDLEPSGTSSWDRRTGQTRWQMEDGYGPSWWLRPDGRYVRPGDGEIFETLDGM